jgi:hypothetical protein
VAEDGATAMPRVRMAVMPKGRHCHQEEADQADKHERHEQIHHPHKR